MPGEEEDDWYCCDDDWSVWLRFETWIWAVLMVVQLSMVVFIVIHGRKDKSFRQAFYVFFVEITLVDCALVLLRPSREEWDETIFGSVYDRPFVEQEDPQTHGMLPYPTIRGVMNQIVVNVVVPALGHAQPLFLTAIAVNRFTAFAFPLKHASMWRARTVVLVTALLAVMSVILGATYPVSIAIFQDMKCSRLTGDQWELLCQFETWAFQQFLVPNALITFTSAICSFVSMVLNVGSIAMLIVMRTTGQLQRKGPELQLFAHSLWMFLLQLLLAFQDIVYFTDNFTEIIAEDLEIWGVRIRDGWTYFRHSSEWLAGVKSRKIRDEGVLYLLPGCNVARQYDNYDEDLPMCPAWYRLLIGELRLREEPDFSVRTMELCLFALSGSVFLLIISGNVRNAYFNFYFKWQCLAKKRWHHSSVNIVTVAARAPTRSVTTRLR